VPVVLPEREVATLLSSASNAPGYSLTVDLESRRVRDDAGFNASFSIDEFRRYCLMEGLDDIGLTLQYEPQIAAYEANQLKGQA
jgi:3-isopropylmalate/(R)-2-methylmalate dehydratase small subunit